MDSMEQQQKPASRAWSNVKSVASTLLFVWLFTHHIAQATVVPTESMSPTILVGDHFFLDKVAFPANYPGVLQKFLPTRTIQRGEIVAFWSPEDRGLRLVKRVIGLPGDVIEIRRRVVYINGRRLEEPYAVHTDKWEMAQRDDMAPMTIPADSFFMMGDNRDNSNDSRFWGVAHHRDFIGTPMFVYWSYDGGSYQPNMTLRETANRYASIATHFFTRTRWFRTGTLVR
ncbi:MAG TPA: signal peptidase I [Terriglobia bacterium]|nr:signal peptidase I [Terriglobia bacterium]